jgi:tetratricopeptide (TPR) repeat protein
MSQNPFDMLRRSSRQAAITTAIGAFIIGGTLALSAWRLYVVEGEVDKKRADIRTLTEQSESLNRRCEVLQRSHEEVLSGLQCKFGGEHEEAIRHFDGVLNVCPNDVVALTYKAGSLMKLGRYAESEGLLRHAIVTHSTFIPAYFTLAVVLHNTGRRAESLRTVEWLLSQDLSNYYVIMYSQDFEEMKDIPEFQGIMARHLDRIRGIQRNLIKMGYYHGNVDGLIGPKTSTAIQDFCSERSLPRQGLTTETLVKAVAGAARE